MNLTIKHKILIIITRNPQIDFALELEKKLLDKNNEVTLLIDDNISLSKKDNVKPLGFYKTSRNIAFRDIWKDSHKLISDWAEEKVAGNTTLRELTQYERISLWDVSIDAILDKLNLLIEKINVIDEVLKIELPDEVIILDTMDLLEQTVLLFCKARKIPIKIYKISKSEYLKCKIFNFINPVIDLARRIKRFLLSIYFCAFNFLQHIRNSGVKPKIIFFSTAERYLDTLLPVMNLFNNNERLMINATAPSLSFRLRRENIYFKEFFGYLLNFPLNRNADKFLRNVWNIITKSKEFQDKLTYKKISLWPILKSIFRDLNFTIFKNYIYRLNVTKKIILSYNPKAIVVLNNPQDIIYNAKKFGVPVISMQCASVEDLIYLGLVSADRVTVDGEYWKNILINRGMLSYKILVTGQPRFDIVFKNMDYYKREKRRSLFNKLGIDKKKKLIVFVGNPITPSMGLFEFEYRESIRMVYRAVKNEKGVQLLIKMHPFECNFRIYTEIAKEMGLCGISIVNDIDKWELLFACDVLITHASTMGYDAIIVDKPVISLQNLNKYGLGILSDDMWNLKESGALVCINNSLELKKAIENILFDSAFASRLKKNRKRYMETHSNYLGVASIRVKKGIEELL